MESLPIIVKAEKDTNGDRLNDYSLEEEDDEYLIEESQNEVNFCLKRHIKIKPSVTKSEQEESLSIFKNSKCNEQRIKEEPFIETKIIVQEELDIKVEGEEDQFAAKYFDPDFKESRKTFTCKYCCSELTTEEFKNAQEPSCTSRKMEQEQHLGGSVFECSCCKLLYTREGDKNKHQARCKKKKEAEEYKESIAKKDTRRNCCDKCSYETEHKRNLLRHIRTHDKVNAWKFSCNQCSFQSIYRSNLVYHLRTHNGFGLLCILCQKFFKRKAQLDNHYVIKHADRADKWGSTITHKINECPKCPYKTVRTGDFKNHLATHGTTLDQAKLKCDVCGYECIQKGNFKKHLRTHVGQLPFVCTQCDKRFNTKQLIDGHIISRHSENEELFSSVTSKVYQCKKCNFKTVLNVNFKKHLKTCV